MLKAYKYRFYPTEEQATNLAQTFGCARVVYNKGLELRKASWENNQVSLSGNDTIKMLPEWKRQDDYSWLNDVSSVVLQQKLLDLDKGFKNFFKGPKSNRKVGYPKFKSKHSHLDSVRYTKSGFAYKGGQIKLAKHKEPLNIVWSRPLPKDANPSSVTVSRNKAGQYHISILVEENTEHLPEINKTIGLDLGIKDHVTTSDGTKHQLPDLSKLEKKIEKLQKRHSNKEKGSKNKEKARLKLSKAWLDLTNKRNDHLHKLSTTLVNENQVICVEDLNISGMVKNHKLARSISRQSWYTFTKMLEYKSEWYGRELIKIDRFYPSSKTCYECKAVVDKLPLNIREWTCTCGATLDRDINAAKNIKAAGLAVSVYGESVRLND